MGADDLFEIVRRDDVPRRAVENVIESHHGKFLVLQILVEHLGVRDTPSRVSVDVDEPLVLGGHLVGSAVPLEVAFLKLVHFGDEWNSKIEAGFILARAVVGAADDIAKPGDKNLFCFIDDIDRRRNHDDHDEKQDSNKY